MVDLPDPSDAAPERRRNHALRSLVDEMLASIRGAANRDLWTPEERAQYERELAVIMARVRSQTMPTGAPDAAGAAGRN